ncbi:hypothetical protein [Peptoniphilus timonensis]|uniref:hypothetical protein n=1 Tax=Peptoniphilus timonensis TaxID=1268254 RepID=UPI0002DB3C91|nr:hypothetical protein [Peptoniphilus timonensis]
MKNEDMNFEEAKEYIFACVSNLALTESKIRSIFDGKDYLEQLIKETKRRFKTFKSDEFEVYYEKYYGLDQLLAVSLDLPITQRFYNDYLQHVYETRNEEEIDNFWNFQKINKLSHGEYNRILGELLREKNNIRFDVDIL